jgi:head-tail adaptor
VIDPGKLDQRIVILRTAETRSPLGGVDKTWVPFRAPDGKVWARVMEGKSRDFVSAGTVTEQGLCSFQVRWAEDLNTLGRTVRVIWNGTVFECLGMTGTRRNGDLWLQCKSIGPSG